MNRDAGGDGAGAVQIVVSFDFDPVRAKMEGAGGRASPSNGLSTDLYEVFTDRTPGPLRAWGDPGGLGGQETLGDVA